MPEPPVRILFEAEYPQATAMLRQLFTGVVPPEVPLEIALQNQEPDGSEARRYDLLVVHRSRPGDALAWLERHAALAKQAFATVVVTERAEPVAPPTWRTHANLEWFTVDQVRGPMSQRFFTYVIDHCRLARRLGAIGAGDAAEGPTTPLECLAGLEQRFQAQSQRIAELEQQLSRVEAEAEAARRHQQQFFANVCHELRTPLAALVGHIQILSSRMPALSSDRENAATLEAIRRSSEHLFALASDYLQLARIEAGNFRIQRRACSPVRLVADVISMMRERRAPPTAPLSVECVGPIPKSIQTDATCLKQILVNLIGNALKFTPRGTVKLQLQLIHDDCSGPELEFRIVDTGVGMSPQEIQRALDASSAGEASTSNGVGTGMGLVICRRLVQMLGGRLAIESQLGKGTTVRFTIDTGPLDGQYYFDLSGERSAPDPATDDTQVDDSQPLRQRKILVAEDDAECRDLLALTLRRAGAAVMAVGDGRKAVRAMLNAVEVGEPFDLSLLDLGLPSLDGMAAAQLARTKGFTGPLIALTARDDGAERQKCLDGGFDNYVTKPIDPRSLVKFLASVLDTGGRVQPVNR